MSEVSVAPTSCSTVYILTDVHGEDFTNKVMVAAMPGTAEWKKTAVRKEVCDYLQNAHRSQRFNKFRTALSTHASSLKDLCDEVHSLVKDLFHPPQGASETPPLSWKSADGHRFVVFRPRKDGSIVAGSTTPSEELSALNNKLGELVKEQDGQSSDAAETH